MLSRTIVGLVFFVGVMVLSVGCATQPCPSPTPSAAAETERGEPHTCDCDWTFGGCSWDWNKCQFPERASCSKGLFQCSCDCVI